VAVDIIRQSELSPPWTVKRPVSTSKFNSYCTFIILVSTIFNALLVGSALFSRPKEYNVNDLEYRSTYVGFDRLYVNKTQSQTLYDPIVNQPRIMAAISSESPSKLAEVWPNKHITADGVVPIAERRLTVSSKVRRSPG
jgi:hypothetical protein